jgi:hypothetical protein
LLKAIATRLNILSKKERYLRVIETVVSVYISTGHCQPGLLCIREDMKCRAPWKREMWLGCEEIPERSKVISTSIVAVGASMDLFFMGFDRFGANADERSVEILVLSHSVVMLSGNSLWHRSVRFPIAKAEEG